MQQHTDSSAAIDFISQFNNTSPNMLSYHAQGGMACMPNDPYQQYNAHTMAMADLQGSEPQQAFPSLTPLAEQLAALQSQHQLIASLQSHQNVLTEQLLPLYNLGDLIAPANAGLSFEAAELLAFKAGFRGPCNPAVVSPGATTNPLYKVMSAAKTPMHDTVTTIITVGKNLPVSPLFHRFHHSLFALLSLYID